ncbi:hypothetical protein BU24DRAFT_250258 [Aaosphaeria arxii CBS 175.79]|uniref:Uncharacterized protein n=1 Tax=Aaosphaeria arxii CBS 175.79 TaxID=1450172 RepID=A0A6A5XKZ8_9PLEO|nr:uncharacterized protein BU24DRAFT_250258 [Aaosphaeria arxii CBS 175.79]KAF2013968.1 hypothetical protein BU24DRAFT_250258 [Aaosphaeria arxii CBS 175.79]
MHLLTNEYPSNFNTFDTDASCLYHDEDDAQVKRPRDPHPSPTIPNQATHVSRTDHQEHTVPPKISLVASWPPTPFPARPIRYPRWTRAPQISPKCLTLVLLCSASIYCNNCMKASPTCRK